ncbi:conserved hypothetical protein [Leishmania major strain Friedlin]|uniref:Uncharacterized protein n=1 Tax=Leishmania major TaxID=5664 RepID=Q4QB42_LEIMA|nr:conserved hypothetical protein [Leishmania major strain Friedlin]CAG9574338.1 hypothetical_protein_-_conserved [Leishmania major strain Friedlin]CAJ04723.1 conserved hypothetical protein [Leishmania major strain Friedlin]|eukprot:XP_001683456.1 conserved hypothetical protein [Leishmania major strain Friedlin]
MKHINVETATREQLVDFIRRMHPQLQREQERVHELESQVSGLQAFIHEKNAEIRELRMQSDRLTEKSASDEETISTLIKQMEEMRSVESPSSSVVPASATTVVQRGRTAEHGKGKSHPSANAGGGEYTPETLQPLETVGNGDGGRSPALTPTPLKVNTESALAQVKSQNAAAAAIAGKMEEIAKLEKKVRELMEVNAFYSAIVSQHDQEEKVRMSQALACRSEHSDDHVAGLQQEVERLQLRISTMAGHGEKLQRMIRAVECEKAALREENEALKRESMVLEAEMEEMTREYARARKSLVAAAAAAVQPSDSLERSFAFAEDVPQVRAASAPQHGLAREPPSRGPTATVDAYSQQPDRRVSYLSTGPAPCVSPLARDGKQGMIGGVAPSAQTASSIATTQSHSRFAFRSLRPIRVRNPDAHERELLDRIHLYEEQFAQMEAFEADRQRSFDEMERNRAELFVSMNSQLEKQRKEIHRLRKLHEETSLKSSVTAHPSRIHSFVSWPNREEEEERGSLRRRGSPSPVERCLTAVPIGSHSLRFVDSSDGLDTADDTTTAWANERENVFSHECHGRQATSGASLVSFSPLDELMWLEKHERSNICVEAVEEELQLFVGMHAATVRLSTGVLEAREAQLLRETTDLKKVVDALQTRVVDLEAQLVSTREAEKVVVGDATESEGMAMAGAADADSPDTNLSHISTKLWKGKALHTALMALEAYGTVLKYHTESIKGFRLNSSGSEEAAVSVEGCMDAEIARDLEEVKMALDAARFPPQLQRSFPQAVTPHLYDDSTASRTGGELLTTCQADTDACDGAEVVGAGSRDQTSLHPAPPQPFSLPTQTQITSSSFHTDSADREEVMHGMAGIVGQVDVISYIPPDIFSNKQGVVRSPRNAVGSVNDGIQEDRMDEDSGSMVAPSHDDAEKAVFMVTEAPGDDAVPLPLCTAEAVTDTSPFQDSLKEEHPQSLTATSGDGDASAGVNLSSEPRQAESSVSESARQDKEDDARREERLSDDSEDDSSMAHDNGTLNSTSLLEVTAGEEAEFLAQLEKEMAKGGLEMVTEPIEAEDGMVASPGDRDINGGGEDREAGCGESQRAGSEVAATEASSTASVSPSPCGADGQQQSRRGGASQEKQELDPAVLEAELDEAASPAESSDGRAGKSAAASSLSPGREDVSEERSSSTSRPSTTSSSSSSSGAGTSTSMEGVHCESAVECDHPAPQIPAPAAGPPLPLPPTSLEALFGAPAAIAASPSTRHDGDRQPFSASPALHPSARFPDPNVSPQIANLGHAMRPTTPPNSMFLPYAQQTSWGMYFSLPRSEDQQLQPAGGSKGPRSHGSRSEDDFEAGFDPFA